MVLSKDGETLMVLSKDGETFNGALNGWRDLFGGTLRSLRALLLICYLW